MSIREAWTIEGGGTMLGTLETTSIVLAVYAVAFLAHRAEQHVSTDR